MEIYHICLNFSMIKGFLFKLNKQMKQNKKKLPNTYQQGRHIFVSLSSQSQPLMTDEAGGTWFPPQKEKRKKI